MSAKVLKFLSIILFIVISTFLWGLYQVLSTHGYDCVFPYDEGATIDMQSTSQFGDYVGGVLGTLLSFVSILYLLATLLDQHKSNKIQSFEAILDSMISRYMSIVEGTSYHNKTAKEALSLLLNHYEIIHDRTENCFKKYQSSLENNDIIKKFIFGHPKIVNELAFGYLMYGYNNFYFSIEKSSIRNEISLKVHDLLQKEVPENELPWFEMDRNNILGHYFRCLFSIVKYIASQKFLNEKEKYQYAKQLRSLLSDKEQILLYYDSLSAWGEPWLKNIGVTKFNKMCYMARFGMIKNTPYNYKYKGINPNKLFEKEIKAFKKKKRNFFEISPYYLE